MAKKNIVFQQTLENKNNELLVKESALKKQLEAKAGDFQTKLLDLEQDLKKNTKSFFGPMQN